MTTGSFWRCCRCKTELADVDDAEWHAVATGHQRVEYTGYGGRIMIIDWRKEPCYRVPPPGRGL